jgi:hypothetical protein
MVETPLEFRIYSLGGRGRAAKWEWCVYKKGGGEVLANGFTVGAKQKAETAARDAMFTIQQTQRRKKEGS